MERAVFARHAESEVNVRGVLNGDPAVASPLTAEGRSQARALGVALAELELELAVTSPFERTRETADLALADRPLPRLVLDELGDPDYGCFEGATLGDYRSWSTTAPSREPAPGGGESRRDLVWRYLAAYRTLLGLRQPSLLVVAHSLPLAYLYAAAQGTPPRPRMGLVAYATPAALDRAAIAAACVVIEAWLASPDW